MNELAEFPTHAYKDFDWFLDAGLRRLEREDCPAVEGSSLDLFPAPYLQFLMSFESKNLFPA